MLAIEMQGICKRFADLTANDHVDFQLEEGEIHALLGENGAGKSTLMRILYGLYQPDSGIIRVQGQAAHLHSPKDAIAHGIGMVTQHFTLVSTLTVAENLALGARDALLHPRAQEEAVRQASEQFGIPVKPGAVVRNLSVGEQQRVEILKALAHGPHRPKARVLILDEPTAVLTPQEVEGLFTSLERLRKDGLSIIFITHKMKEVMAVCDRITVLRDGKDVGTARKSEISPAELARWMVGRERQVSLSAPELLASEPLAAPSGQHPEFSQNTPAALRVLDLRAHDRKGLESLRGVSFDIHAGEILAVAGVSGNGQSELAAVLSGIHAPTGGRVWVGDHEVTGAGPEVLFREGVGRIPEDRHSAVVGELSVAENLVLDQLENFTRGGQLDGPAIEANARKMIAEYQIKAAPRDRARTLSGGNMQKVILARALSRSPRVVIAAQPTRGLDIGATEYVRGRLDEQRKRGAGVLLISEDLDEILGLADRVAVMYEGRLMGILPIGEANVQRLGLMMAGHKEGEHAEI
jgi:simple sugar transport system ATP-binding protein